MEGINRLGGNTASVNELACLYGDMGAAVVEKFLREARGENFGNYQSGEEWVIKNARERSAAEYKRGAELGLFDDQMRLRQPEPGSEEYAQGREAGLFNDKISQEPGLTALIMLNNPSDDFELMAFDEWVKLGGLNASSELTGLWGRLTRVSLPEGVFLDTPIGMVLHPKGTTDGQSMVTNTTEEPGALTYLSGWTHYGNGIFPFRIARIESNAGELWQHPEHNPDGTFTEDKLREIQSQNTATQEVI